MASASLMGAWQVSHCGVTIGAVVEMVCAMIGGDADDNCDAIFNGALRINSGSLKAFSGVWHAISCPAHFSNRFSVANKSAAISD